MHPHTITASIVCDNLHATEILALRPVANAEGVLISALLTSDADYCSQCDAPAHVIGLTPNHLPDDADLDALAPYLLKQEGDQ